MSNKTYTTSDATIFDGKQILTGVLLTSDSTGTAQVDVYDNTSATGDPAFSFRVATANDSKFFDLGEVSFNTGIYVDLNANAESVTVTYK